MGCLMEWTPQPVAFPFSVVRSWLWSEVDRGGSVMHESSEAGLDKNPRLTTEVLPLWCSYTCKICDKSKWTWLEWSRRVCKTNIIKSPSKNKMGILGSSGSDVGFPSSIAVHTVQCKWEGLWATCACSARSAVQWEGLWASCTQQCSACNALNAVQCSGRGSEPTGLDLIICSAANFDNDQPRSRNSQHNRSFVSSLPRVVIGRWEALTAGDKSSWNFSKQGTEGGLGSVNTYNLSSGRQQRPQLARTSLELTPSEA